MTVTPGFIDAHSHPSGVEELYGVNTNLRTVREIQAAIRQKAESSAPEVWINGFMFDDTKLDRPLTRKDLDEATTDASGVGRAPRRPHDLLQQQGVRTGRHHRGTRPIRRTAASSSDNGELNGRVAENARDVFEQRRQARDVHARTAARPRAQRHGAHVAAVQRGRSDDGAQRDGDRRRARSSPTRTAGKNGELTHRAYMMVSAPDGVRAA